MQKAATDNREQALDRAMQQIERAYGKGAIMSLNGRESAAFDGISTGSLSLDLALGGRGVPRGRIIEIYGPESSGKTTLALHIVASAQKSGGVAAFVDAEHALDPTWAKRCGVNLEHLLVSQPDTGEQGLEITEMLVRSNAVDVVVVDSVAALIPKAEIDGEMGDAHVGLQARLMSQAMRKLTGAVSKSRCIVIFINQLREKIGVMFGNPETTPGGRALKFYSSVRIDVRRVASLKVGEQVIGNHVRAKVVKNKVAAPFRTAEFDILFDSGISREADLLELASEIGVIEKTGAWYGYGSARLGQGKDNARAYLAGNPQLFDEIRTRVLEVKGVGGTNGQAKPSPSADAPSAAKPETEESTDAGAEPEKSNGAKAAKPAKATAGRRSK